MYIFSFMWFCIFFWLFCGVFMVWQNVKFAMRILNIFLKFFNRMKQWHLKIWNPVVKPFWSKSYHFLSMINISHCEKMADFDYYLRRCLWRLYDGIANHWLRVLLTFVHFLILHTLISHMYVILQLSWSMWSYLTKHSHQGDTIQHQ